jgi:tripartite ATP-independent transporter DctM subunit
MIELSSEAIIFLLFGLLIITLLSGLPVFSTMGGIGVILILLFWGPKFLPSMLLGNAFLIMTWYTIVAIPLFVFMSVILRNTGVIEDLFRSLRLWLAPIPGGLAMAVVVVSVFVAAMSGMTATGVLILGLIALPVMLKFGYSKEIAMGPIMAGAALASLIPPSNTFIVYGAIAEVSVGRLFIGGIVPGLILAGLFIAYIGVRCGFNPTLGPPLPPEERVGWREKFVSLRGLILPGALIIAVLGSIFMGVASPTEAAGVGAIGSLVCAAIKRNLKWEHVKEACIETFKVTGMVAWIMIGAYVFKSVFVLSGGPHYVTNWVAGFNLPAIGIIGLMQLAYIILGCFVQPFVMLFVSMPVFLPIVDALGLSRLWFGVLFLANTQVADLSPPFGFALFYLRSIAPEGITMRDIVRAVIPFMPLQIIGVALVMFFPQLATWLPSLMLG